MGPGSVGEKMGAYAGDDKESCGKVTDQADTGSQLEELNAGNEEHIPKRPTVQGWGAATVEVDGVVVVVGHNDEGGTKIGRAHV